MIDLSCYDNKSACSIAVAAWIFPQYTMRLVVYEVMKMLATLDHGLKCDCKFSFKRALSEPPVRFIVMTRSLRSHELAAWLLPQYAMRLVFYEVVVPCFMVCVSRIIYVPRVKEKQSRKFCGLLNSQNPTQPYEATAKTCMFDGLVTLDAPNTKTRILIRLKLLKLPIS